MVSFLPKSLHCYLTALYWSSGDLHLPLFFFLQAGKGFPVYFLLKLFFFSLDIKFCVMSDSGAGLEKGFPVFILLLMEKFYIHFIYLVQTQRRLLHFMTHFFTRLKIHSDI